MVKGPFARSRFYHHLPINVLVPSQAAEMILVFGTIILIFIGMVRLARDLVGDWIAYPAVAITFGSFMYLRMVNISRQAMGYNGQLKEDFKLVKINYIPFC